MSVLNDLAVRLQTRGVGTIGTDIFRGRTPDEPDQLVRVQTFDGVNSRIRNDEYLPADERMSVQVLARSLYQGAAETLAESAFDAIQFRSETLTSGRFYPYARAPRYPAYIGVDERGRHLVTFDVEVRRLRDTGL